MMRRNEETARIRCGNTLRFPRARAEPPRSQNTLSVEAHRTWVRKALPQDVALLAFPPLHRLRFPTGVYVYFLRWF